MLKYLLEFKNRSLIIIFAWIFSIFISYFYKETLLYILIKPCLTSHDFEENFYFIYTNITEIFETYLTIVLFIGNQLTFLILIYHLITFLKPGLYKHEHNFAITLLRYNFSITTCIMFLIYYKIIPYSWYFFTNINTSIFKFYLEAKLSEYLTFFFHLYGMGIIYSQFFVFIILFLKTQKNYINKITNTKKMLYFIILLISTVITPPDINSLLVISFFIISLLELLIILIIISKQFKNCNNLKRANN